jgi:HAD superfamily hydrolase (TIGR01662 family)
MWDRYAQIFFIPNDAKANKKAAKDPNVFPIAVLFKYAKEFENPTTGEGFAKVAKVKFKRSDPHWDIKGDGSAIIFDYDDTLRYSKGEKPWPEDPSEVGLMEGRKKLIKKLAKDNLLLGASNQSAIAKGLSDEVAQACFDRTHKLLGVKFEYVYCPHKVPPVNCYCRKPQSGMGVYFVRKYGLDPSKCTYVGDQTTDKTFAKRMGFKFVHEKDFF